MYEDLYWIIIVGYTSPTPSSGFGGYTLPGPAGSYTSPGGAAGGYTSPTAGYSSTPSPSPTPSNGGAPLSPSGGTHAQFSNYPSGLSEI